MAGRDNAVLQRGVNTEIVAVSLFYRARDLGVAPTRRFIEGELERLRSHGPASGMPMLRTMWSGGRRHRGEGVVGRALLDAINGGNRSAGAAVAATLPECA